MSTHGEDNALTDVTNTMSTTAIRVGNTDALKRVRDAQWAEPQKFNYESYNADTREQREAVEAKDDVPAWAANATKYEWSEEYGEVGPAHPQLEQQLFGDENQVRQGDDFEKWVFYMCSLRKVLN